LREEGGGRREIVQVEGAEYGEDTYGREGGKEGRREGGREGGKERGGGDE